MLFINKKRLLALLIFLSISSQLRAQSAIPSLQELIDSAITNDNALANKQLDIKSLEIDQKRLKDAYLPHVSITGKDAFVLTSFAVTTPEIKIAPLGIDIKEGHNKFTSTSNLISANAAAEMLLYSGGKIPNLKKALVEKKKAQTVMLEKDRQEIISIISTAYDQLALLKQTHTVLDESEKRLNENKRTADKALGYGLITKYEYQKIEVAQAQLESKILEYNGKRALVLKQLQLLTKIDISRLAAIDNSLQPFLVDTEVGEIENRSEIKALDAAIAANKYKIEAEKKWFVPKIQAASSFGYLGLLGGHLDSKNPLLPTGKKLSVDMSDLNVFPMFNIGVGFKWDLLDGNTGKREVQKANIELQKTQNDKNEAIEKLELNLANTQTNYSIANSQITVKRKQESIAQNALTQATKEYRVGLIKSSQLIDAETDFQNAALEYVQVIYNQRRAAIELLKATGNLTIQSVQ
jgi:outer membrane protein TolC